jgi:hypothetical protein
MQALEPSALPAGRAAGSLEIQKRHPRASLAPKTGGRFRELVAERPEDLDSGEPSDNRRKRHAHMYVVGTSLEVLTDSGAKPSETRSPIAFTEEVTASALIVRVHQGRPCVATSHV